MSQFRGIGDSATEVKMKQDQMNLQASLAAASRNESARQFDKSQAVQQENTAWTRSQAEAAKAENTRRFELGEQRAERQLTMDEFSKGITQRRDEAQTKLANLQFAQFQAAADEEAKARADRETMAKTAFGSLVVTGRQNGGVMPQKAIDLANQRLGDKNTFIQGGGFDEETGIAWFDVADTKTGAMKTLRLTPENQYTMLHGGLGKEAADAWKETFKSKSSARAAIELRQLEYQEREKIEAAKAQRKLEAERNDPTKQEERTLSRAATYQKQADMYAKMATIEHDPDATDAERKGYREQAATFRKMADSLLIPKKDEPKQLAWSPELESKYGIPSPEVGSRRIQNPDGSVTFTWRDEQDRPVKQMFAPDGRPIDGGKAAVATTPQARPKMNKSQPASQQPASEQAAPQKTPDEQAQEFANTLAKRGLSPEKMKIAMKNQFGEKYADVKGVYVDEDTAAADAMVSELSSKDQTLGSEASAFVENLRKRGSSPKQIVTALQNMFGKRM